MCWALILSPPPGLTPMPLGSPCPTPFQPFPSPTPAAVSMATPWSPREDGAEVQILDQPGWGERGPPPTPCAVWASGVHVVFCAHIMRHRPSLSAAGNTGPLQMWTESPVSSEHQHSSLNSIRNIDGAPPVCQSKIGCRKGLVCAPTRVQGLSGETPSPPNPFMSRVWNIIQH